MNTFNVVKLLRRVSEHIWNFFLKAFILVWIKIFNLWLWSGIFNEFSVQYYNWKLLVKGALWWSVRIVRLCEMLFIYKKKSKNTAFFLDCVREIGRERIKDIIFACLWHYRTISTFCTISLLIYFNDLKI